MKKMMKRLLVLILCMTMVVNGQTIGMLAVETETERITEAPAVEESATSMEEVEASSENEAVSEERAEEVTEPDTEVEEKQESMTETETSEVPETGEVKLQAGSMSIDDWAAGFSGGSGTKDDPYTILSFNQLKHFNEHYNDCYAASSYYYKLRGSIDYRGNEWTPIKEIAGFDGSGYSIGNLKINLADELPYNGSALFYTVKELKNLTVDDVKITDSRSTTYGDSLNYSVLCFNQSKSSSIEKCYVSGDIELTVESKYTSGMPSFSAFTYMNYGTINNCQFTGNVTFDGKVSGIVYDNYGTIKNCRNYGRINSATGNGYYSGIAYYNARNGVIDGCSNESDIKIEGEKGYVCGIVYNSYDSEVSGCYNYGALEGNAVAGIAGQLTGGSLYKCHNTGDITGKTAAGLIVRATKGNIYESENTGMIQGDKAYGCFASNHYYDEDITISKCVNKGEVIGNEEAAGIIGEVEFEKEKNDCFKMVSCVNEGDVTVKGTNNNAAGIVCTVNAYLYDNRYVLFSKCSNTGKITSTATAAGIACRVSGAATFDECSNEGEVVGGYSSGVVEDIVPYTFGSRKEPSTAIIKRCSNAGIVTGSQNAAGIVTDVTGGTIENCYNMGKITAHEAVGGIVGKSQNYESEITISDCYNAGNIISTNPSGYSTMAGGIVGYISEWDNYKYLVQNCYNVGKMTCEKVDDSFAGQLFGYIATYENQKDYIEINGCYYSKDLGTSICYTNLSDSDKDWLNSQGVFGVSTEDMKKQSTFTGYDFTDTWSMGDEEYPYPILSCIGAGDAFRITYVLSGGKNNKNNATRFYQDDEVTLYPATKDGYSFDGWYEDATFKTPISGISGSIRKNITVYAKWLKGDEKIDTVTVNGSGVAYLWGTLYDNDGSILKGQQFDWELYDVNDPDNEKAVAIGSLRSDEMDGSYHIVTPNLINNSKTNTITQKYKICLSIPYDGWSRKLGYVITTDVKVVPFGYSQTWDMGVSLKGGASADLGLKDKELGEATLEASLGSLGADGSIGRRVTVEQEFEDGKRDVTIKESYASKIGGNFSFGPEFTVKAGNIEYAVPTSSLGMGVEFGSTISPGLELENYNPNDSKDVTRLGKFMMNSVAMSTGNLLLASMVRAASGTGYVNSLENEYTYSLNGSASAGKDFSAFGGFGVSRSYDGTKIFKYSEQSNLDKLTESKTTSFKVDRSLDSGVDKKVLGIKTASGVNFGSGSSFSISAPHSSVNDVPNVDWVKFTMSDTNSHKTSFIVGSKEETNTSKTTIKYSDKDAIKICQDVDAIGKFAYGEARYVLDSEHPNLIGQINESEAKGTYEVKKEASSGKELEIPIKVPGFSVKFSMAGSYEEGFSSESGDYILGVAKTYTTSDKNEVSEANVNDITKLIIDPFEYYFKKAKEAIGEIAEAIERSSEILIFKAQGTLKVVSGAASDVKSYAVHLFTTAPDELNTTELQVASYEVPKVNSADNVSLEEVNDETVFTVGYPYFVYLTDESSEAAGLEEADRMLDAFPEGDKCTITLAYTLNDLNAAGIKDINGGNLGIYRYLDDLQGYECLGGVRDYANKTVSVDIKTPGQFILAVDDDMPVVSDILISDHSATPEITVLVDEKSGFGELSFKIDDKEVINKDNYKAYYSVKNGKLVYKIDEADALTDGTHSVSFYAVDGAGNGMPNPVTKEFSVHNAKPEIEKAECYIEGNDIRIRANFKEFGDAFEESVYLEDVAKITAAVTEIRNVNGKGPEVATSEFELHMAGKSRYVTGVGDREFADGSVIKYVVIITDINGNETVKEFDTAAGTGVVRSGNASNDLWYYIPISSMEYTGTAIKPVVYVFNGDRLLIEKQDYTLSYKNNTNASKYADGSVSDKIPCVVVTGKGNYSQKDTIDFEIVQKDITDEDIIVADVATALSTGKQQKPVTAITWDKKKLTSPKDYKITYCVATGSEPTYSEQSIIPEAVGDYFVIIKAEPRSNYKGQAYKTFKIVNKDEYKLISKASVTKIKDKQYTGSPVLPEDGELKVKDGRELVGISKDSFVTLSEDEKSKYDYYYEYANNVEVGAASVILTGVGKYAGTKTVTYKITGVPITKVTVSSELIKKNNFVYDYTEHTLTDLMLTYKANKNAATVSLKGINKSDYEKLSDSERKAYHYTYEYQNNINSGTASVTLAGVNGYTGTTKKNFKIAKYTIRKDVTPLVTASLDNKEYAYSAVGTTPKPEVKYLGRILTEGKDYTLTYTNNKAVNDGSNAKKLPTVTIKPIGNFTGAYLACNYKISQIEIDAAGVTVSAPDKVYADKKGAWKSTVTVAGKDGKKLAAKNNFATKVTYRYLSFTDDRGNDTSTCHNIKNVTNAKSPETVTRSKGDEVNEFDIVPAGTTIEVVVNGEGNYKGSVSGAYRVTKYDIAKLTVVVNNGKAFTYNSRAIRLRKSDIVLKKGKDVLTDVTYHIDESTYKNNINKGKASVIIRGDGEYGGAKTVTYSIGNKLFFWRFK